MTVLSVSAPKMHATKYKATFMLITVLHALKKCLPKQTYKVETNIESTLNQC